MGDATGIVFRELSPVHGQRPIFLRQARDRGRVKRPLTDSDALTDFACDDRPEAVDEGGHVLLFHTSGSQIQRANLAGHLLGFLHAELGITQPRRHPRTFAHTSEEEAAAPTDDNMDIGDCWNCGGSGFVSSCFEEFACADPESGCDLCTRRCDVCHPPRTRDGSQSHG